VSFGACWAAISPRGCARIAPAFLPQPFSRRALLDVVRRVLDG